MLGYFCPELRYKDVERLEGVLLEQGLGLLKQSKHAHGGGVWSGHHVAGLGREVVQDRVRTRQRQ